MASDAQDSLTQLPNIGPNTVRLLLEVGIRTPRDLRRLGAVTAARRIRALRPNDPPCRSLLAGLEGAIRGIRWPKVPWADRQKLWREYTASPPRPRQAGNS